MIGVCVRRYPISLVHGAGLIGCGQLNKDLRTLSFRISGCGALTGAVDAFLNPSDDLPPARRHHPAVATLLVAIAPKADSLRSL